MSQKMSSASYIFIQPQQKFSVANHDLEKQSFLFFLFLRIFFVREKIGWLRAMLHHWFLPISAFSSSFRERRDAFFSSSIQRRLAARKPVEMKDALIAFTRPSSSSGLLTYMLLFSLTSSTGKKGCRVHEHFENEIQSNSVNWKDHGYSKVTGLTNNISENLWS